MWLSLLVLLFLALPWFELGTCSTTGPFEPKSNTWPPCHSFCHCTVCYSSVFTDTWCACAGISGSSRASWSSSSTSLSAAAAADGLPPATPHLRARRSLPDSTTSALQTSPKRPRRHWQCANSDWTYKQWRQKSGVPFLSACPLPSPSCSGPDQSGGLGSAQLKSKCSILHFGIEWGWVLCARK